MVLMSNSLQNNIDVSCKYHFRKINGLRYQQNEEREELHIYFDSGEMGLLIRNFRKVYGFTHNVSNGRNSKGSLADKMNEYKICLVNNLVDIPEARQMIIDYQTK